MYWSHTFFVLHLIIDVDSNTLSYTHVLNGYISSIQQSICPFYWGLYGVILKLHFISFIYLMVFGRHVPQTYFILGSIEFNTKINCLVFYGYLVISFDYKLKCYFLVSHVSTSTCII